MYHEWIYINKKHCALHTNKILFKYRHGHRPDSEQKRKHLLLNISWFLQVTISRDTVVEWRRVFLLQPFYETAAQLINYDGYVDGNTQTEVWRATSGCAALRQRHKTAWFVIGIVIWHLLVSLNRLSVGCGTTPRRQSGESVGFLIFIHVIYTMLPSHGHSCRKFELYFYLFCVNISLILNIFFII